MAESERVRGGAARGPDPRAVGDCAQPLWLVSQVNVCRLPGVSETGDTHAVERLAHKVVEWLEEWCGVVVVEDLYV